MKIDEMMKFTMDAHNGQYRKNIKLPYFTHCVEVMKRVSLYTQDEDILCIANGHDLIEDCGVTFEMIEDEFNQRIAIGIAECSREGGDHVPKIEKYRFMESFAYGKSMDSILVKIADRYCNVHDYLSVPKKRKYASKYALQAYPLYQAYLEKMKNLTHDVGNVAKDLATLQQIILAEYPVNIHAPDAFEKVKLIVL